MKGLFSSKMFFVSNIVGLIVKSPNVSVEFIPICI